MSPYAPPRAILRVLPDERLARHAAGGSEQAFAILYDRHARDLLATCRSIVRDEDDARDALQSTMLNAWRAIGRRGDAPVRPWLFRIARNEAITVLRRRRPAAELHEDAGTRPDLHEEAVGRAELAGLLDGLDDLSDRQREALVLRTFGDAGYDEIARRQETSPQAVRQSVAHARRTLRRRRFAGLIPIPAWLADLAASAGTTGAPTIQAGVAKTAVGVTAAVAVVGGTVGPSPLPRHRAPEKASAATTRPAGATGTRAPSTTAAVAARAALASPAPAPPLTRTTESTSSRRPTVSRTDATAVPDPPMRSDRSDPSWTPAQDDDAPPPEGSERFPSTVRPREGRRLAFERDDGSSPRDAPADERPEHDTAPSADGGAARWPRRGGRPAGAPPAGGPSQDAAAVGEEPSADDVPAEGAPPDDRGGPPAQ